ncbi:hypothetical protein [Secundilactobacillus similis]|uniref:hypothetical protein n=1 Tax=Secundilactobacillus similis TaxID=414682 RepID=UPI0006D1629E|nr:hypothetical protein [Secundilactobacillus similis]
MVSRQKQCLRTSNGKDFAKDASVKQSVDYNPTLAKKYWAKGMKELGMSKMTLNLVCYDVDAFKQSAEFIQSSAQKYLKGLKININVQPKVQAITTMQQKKGYDLALRTGSPHILTLTSSSNFQPLTTSTTLVTTAVVLTMPSTRKLTRLILTTHKPVTTTLSKLVKS